MSEINMELLQMDMENGEQWRNPFNRVLGESLGQFRGKHVFLVGEVVSVHPNGSTMKLKTTDDKIVTVELQPDNMDLPQGIIELRATVVTNEVLSCVDFVQFETDPQAFDAETYTEAVRLILKGDTPWTR